VARKLGRFVGRFLAVLVLFGLVWFGFDLFGLVLFGLVWFGLVLFGFGLEARRVC
jgi:hypothetical protein